MEQLIVSTILEKLFLTSILFSVAASVNDHRDIYAEFNKDGEISSPGFPDSCCTAFSFSIQKVIWGNNVGYIRMVFSDLDLPKGSKLQIYDGTTAISQYLFPNQPELRRGVWSRPSISSSKPGGAIHVKFTPPLTTNSSAYTVNFTHTGFKASYWVTNSPPENWHDKAVPGVCKPIVSSVAGEKVMQKTMDYGDYHGTTIDCVWQLKVPTLPVGSALKQENLEVYLRVETLDFQHGYLDIIKGISSEGVIIRSLDSEIDDTRNIESLQQSAVGYVSSEGLYIHLTMLNEGRGVFRFVYGLRHKQQNLIGQVPNMPYTCDFGDWGVGFTCSQDEESWCIPPQNKCNHASNCPNGEDEDEEKACPPEGYLPPTTTTTTTTTTAKPNIQESVPEPKETCDPVYSLVMCQSWKCDYNFKCRKYEGGLKCPEWGKTIWCPGVGCISQYEHGYDCSGYCKKCPDGSCSLTSECSSESTTCPFGNKRCKNGDCVDTYQKCPGECYTWEKKCDDGSCIPHYEHCGGDDPCDYSSDIECDNGRECYSVHDKCDGYEDCSDGSDEENCPTRFNTKIWGMIIAVPVLIVVILYVCYKRCNKTTTHTHTAETSSPEHSNGANRTTYRPVPTQNINTGSHGFTGTRMTPTASPSARNHGNQAPGHAPEPTAPPPAEASAPPPSYTDVMEDESTYQRPSTDGEAPPPSYSSVSHQV